MKRRKSVNNNSAVVGTAIGSANAVKGKLRSLATNTVDAVKSINNSKLMNNIDNGVNDATKSITDTTKTALVRSINSFKDILENKSSASAEPGSAANKSAANKSAANKSAANKSAANKSAANKSAANNSTANKSTANKSVKGGGRRKGRRRTQGGIGTETVKKALGSSLDALEGFGDGITNLGSASLNTAKRTGKTVIDSAGLTGGSRRRRSRKGSKRRSRKGSKRRSRKGSKRRSRKGSKRRSKRSKRSKRRRR